LRVNTEKYEPSVENINIERLGSSLDSSNFFVCNRLTEVIIADVPEDAFTDGKTVFWLERVYVVFELKLMSIMLCTICVLA
jgi:hypothetical protein